MKASSREDVAVHWFLDDVFQETRIEKNRCIYKKKDGTERITGFGQIKRDAAGKPFVERRGKTIQPLNMYDILKRVKETGGVVVVLPP
jgi:hypothetical protein